MLSLNVFHIDEVGCGCLREEEALFKFAVPWLWPTGCFLVEGAKCSMLTRRTRDAVFDAHRSWGQCQGQCRPKVWVRFAFPEAHLLFKHFRDVGKSSQNLAEDSPQFSSGTPEIGC